MDGSALPICKGMQCSSRCLDTQWSRPPWRLELLLHKSSKERLGPGKPPTCEQLERSNGE
jgi:hypothetical protein